MSVHVCSVGTVEERCIFLFNPPSQDPFFGVLRQLIYWVILVIYVFDTESFDTQLCTEKQSWKCRSKTRTDCCLAVVLCGGCHVQKGANLLLFFTSCIVLCDTNLSPLADSVIQSTVSTLCVRVSLYNLYNPELFQMKHCTQEVHHLCRYGHV